MRRARKWLADPINRDFAWALTPIAVAAIVWVLMILWVLSS